jgi:hypothetical protein
MNGIIRGTLILATSSCALGIPSPLSAAEFEIPAFARRYGMSCSPCHDPIPRLTALGEAFAGNGFRLAAEEPPRDTINTGDRLLELTRSVPLAIRLDAYVQAFNNGGTASDFKLPYNLKILSGGTISQKLSYYFYFFLFERGEIGGIEDAFIQVNDVGGQPIDVAVGQFQVSDPMFKRELRLEFEDYAVYRARIGLQPADLTYDRGIMVATDFAGFTFTGEIVNGNGKGEAEPDLRLDNDAAKSVFGHLTRDISPNVRLGVMAYGGKQKGAASETAPEVKNTLWMLGADATISVGPLEINGQYIHREDEAPTFSSIEANAKLNGGFLEVLVLPPASRWYGLALYNRVDVNRPLLNVRLGGPANVDRYQTVTGGVGYVLRRNFRVLGEVTWDTELEEARWTLGLVSAF